MNTKKKKVKGIVIDSLLGKVREQIFNDDTILTEIYETLECHVMTVPIKLSAVDSLYVDDMPYLEEKNYYRAFMLDDDPEKIFYGTGVILAGVNSEFISTTLTAEEVRKRVTFEDEFEEEVNAQRYEKIQGG